MKTLQVLREFNRVLKGRTHRMLLMRCYCGKRWVAFRDHIRSGHTKSCGCHRRENSRRMLTTHGLSKTPEANVWNHMKRRCLDPKNTHFAYYGGRGIKVCARWLDFATFFADMGPRPSPKHSLDRKNNDGDYEPGNCRWATEAEQRGNRSDARRITFEGRTQSLTAWAQELGLNISTLHQRLARWPLEEAMSSRKRKNQFK